MSIRNTVTRLEMQRPEYPKIFSKLMRLKARADIERLLTSLPFDGSLQELHGKDDTYAAEGTIRTGARRHKVKIRIRLYKSALVAEILSKTAGIDFQHPFRTEEDRRECVVAAVKAVRKQLN